MKTLYKVHVARNVAFYEQRTVSNIHDVPYFSNFLIPLVKTDQFGFVLRNF
jgi:hypothetical protein